MPRVPVYDGQRVREAAGPQSLGQITARADGEAFNAGASSSQIAQAGERLYNKVRENADQVAVMEADRQMSALETKLLYDPSTGAFNKRGKDAFGSVERVNSDFDTARDDIESSLSNEQQKIAFRSRYQQRREQINRQLNQHVAGEIQRYDNAETESYIENERNLVAANPYDTENVRRSKESQAAAIYQHAQRNGMPEEWAKQKILEAESKTNVAAISQMLASGQDLAAAQYFKDNRETFHGDDLTKATRMVEESSALGASMRNADDIFQKTGTLTQAMAQAKEIENPKVRQATESRLQHLFQQKKMAANDRAENINKAAAQFIDSGQGTGDDFLRLNPQLAISLDTSQLTTIRQYRMGGAEKTDQKVWYSLRELAANPDTRADFIKADLYKYRNSLSGSDFQELAKLQLDARQGNTKGLDGFQSDSAIVNSSLKQMGYSDSQIKDNSDEGVVSFRTQIDEWIIGYKQSTGKSPNNNDLRKAIAAFQYEAVTEKNNFWFDKKKRFFQMTDEEIGRLSVNDIPKNYRDQIADTLRRAGRPINDANQLDLWVKKLKKDSGRKSARAE